MLTKDDIQVIEDLRKELEREKAPMIEKWKKIAPHIGTAYGDWGTDPNNVKYPDYVNTDSTMATASKTLADGIEGYAFSNNMEWFDFDVVDVGTKDDGTENDPRVVRSLLEKVRKSVYQILADADFYDEARSAIRSGCDMATGVMIMSFDKRKGQCRYVTAHLKDVLPVCDEYDDVDSMMRYVYLTKKQAVRFFGEDADLPDVVKDSKKPLEKFCFINFVAPVLNWDFDIRGDGDIFSIWYFEKDLEKTLREERFSVKNFTCWRYSRPIYGGTWGVDSPGFLALPMAHFLNILIEDFITLGELQAKGLWKKTKGLKVNFKAGAVNELESNQDFGQVQPQGDLSWLQLQIDHYRQVINEMYNTDLFLVLTQNIDKTKTATEVSGIENEKNNLMSAFFTRLSREFLEPVVMWTFQTALMNAMVPDVTMEEIEVLRTLDFKVKFVSPAFRAQEKAFELTNTIQWMNDIISLAQVQSSVMDRFDWDRFIELDHEIRHAKAELLIPLKDAQKARAARAQQQEQMTQQAQSADALSALGDAYTKFSKSPEQGSVASALTGGK